MIWGVGASCVTRGDLGCHFEASWVARAAKTPGLWYPRAEKSENVITGVEQIQYPAGVRAKNGGPQRSAKYATSLSKITYYWMQK